MFTRWIRTDRFLGIDLRFRPADGRGDRLDLAVPNFLPVREEMSIQLDDWEFDRVLEGK